MILNKRPNYLGGTLAFGAAEGVVYAFNGNPTISSAITGTGGVTFSSNNQNMTISGSNTFTGGVAYNGLNFTPHRLLCSPTYFGANSNVVTFERRADGQQCERRRSARSAVLGPAGLRPSRRARRRGHVGLQHLRPRLCTRLAAATGGFTYLSGNNSYTGGTFINGKALASSRLLPTPISAALRRPSSLKVAATRPSRSWAME